MQESTVRTLHDQLGQEEAPMMSRFEMVRLEEEEAAEKGKQQQQRRQPRKMIKQQLRRL